MLEEGIFLGIGPVQVALLLRGVPPHQPPIPASRPTKLRMLHKTAPGVGLFATSGSCGQLLV